MQTLGEMYACTLTEFLITYNNHNKQTLQFHYYGLKKKDFYISSCLCILLPLQCKICPCVLRTTFCTVLVSWLYEASSSSPEAFVFTLSWFSNFKALLDFITILLLTLLFAFLLEVKACPQSHNASLTCTILLQCGHTFFYGVPFVSKTCNCRHCKILLIFMNTVIDIY